MSKTKLALFLFTIAFGVNILSFVFTKKAFVVEEVKNLWLYELPLTASPLDSYVAVDLGPQNGVIGTLNHLMEKMNWTASELTIDLVPGLTFSTGEPIRAEHWIQSRSWALAQIEGWKADPLWQVYLDATVEWINDQRVRFTWKNLPKEYRAENFVKTILSHPMTGVFHPSNLEAMKREPKNAGKKLTREWISSGPYKVRKWNPKEIVLVSRDDFPVTIPKAFFRTLKYQSAPVKNPSCDFMQAQPGDEKTLEDHRVNPVDQTLHLFWVCRSWNENGRFCSDPKNREGLNRILSSAGIESGFLKGTRIRYRIPFGSDSFRQQVIEQLKAGAEKAGAGVEEISYLFKPSTDADIELLFVISPSSYSPQMATEQALLSSRIGLAPGSKVPYLLGEITRFPIQILMKHMKGNPYSKVFLDPDLDEKKLPL